MSKLKKWPWLFLCLGIVACRQPEVDEGSICQNDDDCGEGQLCFWQRCLSKGSSSSLIYAEVLPPAISRDPPYHVGRPYDLANSETWKISLPVVTQRQVKIQGIRGGYYHLQPADSLLSAWQQSGHLVADANSDISGSFINTRLIPGNYQLAIWPQNSSLPAYHSLLTVAEDLTYIMAYPVEHLLSYSGHIQWEKSTASPVEGAEITAVDLAGNYCGQSQSDRDGNYHLNCFDGSSLAHILTNSGVLNPLVPALDMAIDWTTITDRQLPNLIMGEDLPLSYQFNGQILDSNSDPISGASVTVIESFGSGTFQDSGFSQKNGQVGLTVWGEQQAAIVATRAGYDWQAEFLVLPRDGSSETFSITLPPPFVVEGYILESSGAVAVSGAQVIFTTEESVQSGSFGILQQHSVTSDSNGHYSVQLPHGDYNVLVKPAPTSGQAWGSFFIRVNSSVERHFYLPRPYRFNGRVVKNGVAVPKAQVNFFSLDNQQQDESQQIGQSITDDNGNFLGVVPAN